MTATRAEKKFSPNVLTDLALALLPLGAAFGQNAPMTRTTKAASPKISTAFSKAAIKALVTIERTNNKDLLDAAMIDLSGAETNHTELSVLCDVQLFEAIYGIQEAVRQSELSAERAEAEAYSDHPLTYSGSSAATTKIMPASLRGC